jgi:hypothetical protein
MVKLEWSLNVVTARGMRANPEGYVTSLAYRALAQCRNPDGTSEAYHFGRVRSLGGHKVNWNAGVEIYIRTGLILPFHHLECNDHIF